MIYLVSSGPIAAQEETRALPALESEVVAMVNGQKITRQELSDLLIESFGEQALDIIIRRVVIYQQAAKLGITVGPQEVEKRLDALLEGEVEALVKARGLKDQKELEEELRKIGMDLGELKEKMSARLRKGMEVELLAEKIVETSVSLSEEDLSKAYDEEYGEKIEALQIVMGTKKDAEDILKKLKAGADFETLARNESIDRLSAASGGKMRPFGPKERVFGPAVASLKNGEVSDIVKTDDGYHILKVINKRPKSQEKFKDVKSDLEKTLKQRTVKKRLGPWLASLLERAEIKKYLTTY